MLNGKLLNHLKKRFLAHQRESISKTQSIFLKLFKLLNSVENIPKNNLGEGNSKVTDPRNDKLKQI